MFDESLKVGGKTAIHYLHHLPPFELNGYKEPNPENAERIICQMYQCESKGRVEQYCLSVGFKITRSYKEKALSMFLKTS